MKTAVFTTLTGKHVVRETHVLVPSTFDQNEAARLTRHQQIITGCEINYIRSVILVYIHVSIQINIDKMSRDVFT